MQGSIDTAYLISKGRGAGVGKEHGIGYELVFYLLQACACSVTHRWVFDLITFYGLCIFGHRIAHATVVAS